MATRYSDYVKKVLPRQRKEYYIRSYLTYTLTETDSTKTITFSAGLECKGERVSSTYPITVTVTAGNYYSGTKTFNAPAGTQVQFVSNKVTYKKTNVNRNVKVNVTVDFGTSIFSGLKAPITLDLLIPALDYPIVNLVATRTNDTTATLTLTTKKSSSYVVNAPTIKNNGTTISPTWKVGGTTVSFPYTASSGTTSFVATTTVDPMHNFSFEYSGTVGGKSYTDKSTIHYVYAPEWKQTVSVNKKVPFINYKGLAEIDIWVKDYKKSTQNNTVMTLLPNKDGYKINVTDSTHWSVSLSLSEQYVENPTIRNTKAKVVIDYRTWTALDGVDKQAIFSTTRNANYSTGLANNVFMGGCTLTDYSSRVWYSYVNNPLYMPDTNYIEVGSNDTMVMGLVKVGDYLGIIKQSKSVDASVFLVYPTSFDDETTFATKPCVSGIGALGKYCFNVLGDETLFLSPRGVMAIEPSEDEQSRVKDRSYFVNGRMLNEINLGDEAYSFVWNGMYLLAINNHIYVLDGNQRNSWGNQKTNLVYECYFLDNVPASILFSYDNQLWFADKEGNLCRFKEPNESDAYMDEDEPVVAEWSTIADDDNALNYYKTMQKKGNLVSLLPEEGSTAEVYLKRDEEQPFMYGNSPAVDAETELPVSYYVKKKLKKYKRLQFIIKDTTANPFGVNKIIKSYVLGNYAKK